MNFKKGFALINSKWEKVEYPFPRTLRRTKKGLRIIDGNVETLITEIYTLVNEKKGRKEVDKFSVTFYYPKSIYRFKGYELGE
jgi:hypothetical protein